MKKTYINPELEVIRIATQQMLAQSVGYDSTPIDNPIDVDGHEDDFDWSE